MKKDMMGLAQENGFAPADFLILLRLIKGASKECTCWRRV
jgi:hypothetical protein